MEQKTGNLYAKRHLRVNESGCSFMKRGADPLPSPLFASPQQSVTTLLLLLLKYGVQLCPTASHSHSQTCAVMGAGTGRPNAACTHK